MKNSKIWTIALYEMLPFLRSKLFKFATFFYICILSFFNLRDFFWIGSWQDRAIASSIAYTNVILLNVLQAIVVVFAVMHCAKNDTNNSTDSLYPRSFSNIEYIIGKMLGISIPIIALNIFVLICSIIATVVFIDDVSPALSSYFIYFLLISMPTFVFIFGLSSFTAGVLRSQGLTATVLIVYLVGSLVYLKNNTYHLFDCVGWNVPFMYSTFTGFGNVASVVLHRSMYLFLGIGFIFASVFLYRRLPQSKTWQRISINAIWICFFAAIVLGVCYVGGFTEGRALREKMRTINNEYKEKTRLSLTDCTIDLTHKNDSIDVTADLAVSNSTESAIEEYIFSLNPGLKVQSILHNGQKVAYTRNEHIISIKAPTPLSPGDMDSLTIMYTGSIDENACYIDIEESEHILPMRHGHNSIKKRYGYIQSDYVLLTCESMWYPIAGIFPQSQINDFIKFNLTVHTDKQLTVLSQGATEQNGDGRWIFSPENPLPQLSLIIGQYEKKSLTVDEIEYSLYIKAGHDYFSRYFTEITGDMPQILRDWRNSFEILAAVKYPFNRFSLVEVPISFYAYERDWTIRYDTLQPEQIFLPELGTFLNLMSHDFENWQNPLIQKRINGKVYTKKDAQSWSFNLFVYNELSLNLRLYDWKEFSYNDPKRILTGKTAILPQRTIAPMFFSVSNAVNSERYPLFNSMFEHYFRSRIEISNYFDKGYMIDVGRALSKQSLAEILDDPSQKMIRADALKVKSEFFFSFLMCEIQKEDFEAFLFDFLEANRFRIVDFNEFAAAIHDAFGIDISAKLDAWYHETLLPGFIFEDLICTKVLDGNRERYQITFTVTNPTSTDGVFEALVDISDGPKLKQLVSVNNNQSKQISMLVDQEPLYEIYFDTILSQHIPVDFSKHLMKKDSSDIEIYDGERVLEYQMTRKESSEIIVDNEDAGFRILSEPDKPLLARLLPLPDHENKVYNDIPLNKIPSKWVMAINKGFNGLFSKTAHIIRAGKGDQKVRWETELSEEGIYDVYCFSPFSNPEFINAQYYRFVKDMHFAVLNNDEFEQVTIDPTTSEDDWILLGTYQLYEGTTAVELSNQSNGKMVIADAVKWVKKQ